MPKRLTPYKEARQACRGWMAKTIGAESRRLGHAARPQQTPAAIMRPSQISASETSGPLVPTHLLHLLPRLQLQLPQAHHHLQALHLQPANAVMVGAAVAIAKADGVARVRPIVSQTAMANSAQ